MFAYKRLPIARFYSIFKTREQSWKILYIVLRLFLEELLEISDWRTAYYWTCVIEHSMTVYHRSMSDSPLLSRCTPFCYRA